MKTIVKFGVASVFGSVCVLASSMSAYALDFNFSFYGDQGSYPGTETGIIQGLSDNNSATTPSNIIITSNTVGIPSGTSLIFQGGSFNVANGNIVDVNNIYANNGNYYFYLNNNNSNSIVNSVGFTSFNDSYNSNGFSGATYSAATSVPWEWNPVEGSALGVPLFIGLRFLKKSKSRKSTMSKIAETIS